MSVGKLAQNDPVGAMYVDHHGWLLGWLRRRLSNSHQAADLAQDTFLRVLSSDRDICPTEPRAFLTTVAKRVLSNHYRRLQIEQAYLDVLALQPEATTPDAETRMLLIEALTEIDAMLGKLPAKCRAAFLMSQLDGMAYAEIAIELDVSISSVKKYMARAAACCYFGC